MVAGGMEVGWSEVRLPVVLSILLPRWTCITIYPIVSSILQVVKMAMDHHSRLLPILPELGRKIATSGLGPAR